jgi:hypothetical protein
MVESRIERGDKIETAQRSYISSRTISAAAFADAARSHWAIRNNLHWTPRRDLQRGSVTPARRSRRQKHGRGPPLSPSIWWAKSPTNDPSSAAESAPLAILNTCSKYWGRCDVNLDSLPYPRPAVRCPRQPGPHAGQQADCAAALISCSRAKVANRGLAPPYFVSASILAAARVENTQLGNRAR